MIKINYPSDSYAVSSSAPINIAVIKYWGKRDEILNLPLNSSLSITISKEALRTETTVIASKTYDKDEFWLNGQQIEISSRIRTVIHEFKSHAKSFCGDSIHESSPLINDISQYRFHIHSFNHGFPTKAGLASSASGISALVIALAYLFNLQEDTDFLSCIARRGSGSACRSLYGGFVSWNMGEKSNGFDSISNQVYPANYWPDLRCIVLVTPQKSKEIGSTVGMKNSLQTSEYLRHSAKHVVPSRFVQMITAIKNKDFSSFSDLTMKESNRLHSICLDTYPPLLYLSVISFRIMNLVHRLNKQESKSESKNIVAYTFDAGSNAILFTLKENLNRIIENVCEEFHFQPIHIEDPLYLLKNISHQKQNQHQPKPYLKELFSFSFTYIHKIWKYWKYFTRHYITNDRLDKIIITTVGDSPSVSIRHVC